MVVGACHRWLYECQKVDQVSFCLLLPSLEGHLTQDRVGVGLWPWEYDGYPYLTLILPVVLILMGLEGTTREGAEGA